jgi:hypothetical protein
VTAKLDLAGSRDHLLEREPPKLAPSGRIVRGDVEGEWQRTPLEQRISVAEGVQVALVEGETDEAPRLVFSEAPHYFIEGDNVEPGLFHLIEHGLEKVGGDFKVAVGRKGLRLRWPHMVERENHAGSLGVGRK